MMIVNTKGMPRCNDTSKMHDQSFCEGLFLVIASVVTVCWFFSLRLAIDVTE